MIRRREAGVVMAWSKGECGYAIHPDEWESVRAAFMGGKAFVGTRSLHGSAMVIKLGAIECLQFSTPDSIAEALEEGDADRADDALAGRG